LTGVLAGGARFAQGYGGMLSDNNTMALAFAVGMPLCWFGAQLTDKKWMGLGMRGLAVLSMAGVVFTHSRGGVLAVGAGLLLMAIRSKQRILAALLLVGAMGGTVYMVRDGFVSRMETLRDVSAEESANSRVILAKSALKMALDHPLFGVGFTEVIERRLISKYVPPEYAEAYAGKVIHNTYAQWMVDAGFLGLFFYCVVLFGTIFRLQGAIRRARAPGFGLPPLIPVALQTALIVYAVGSTFLSRTTFDVFYLLIMMAATWFRIEQDQAARGAAPVAMAPVLEELPVAPPVSEPVQSPTRSNAPWLGQAQGESRVRMGRERRNRPE